MMKPETSGNVILNQSNVILNESNVILNESNVIFNEKSFCLTAALSHERDSR